MDLDRDALAMVTSICLLFSPKVNLHQRGGTEVCFAGELRNLIKPFDLTENYRKTWALFNQNTL